MVRLLQHCMVRLLHQQWCRHAFLNKLAVAALQVAGPGSPFISFLRCVLLFIIFFSVLGLVTTLVTALFRRLASRCFLASSLCLRAFCSITCTE